MLETLKERTRNSGRISSSADLATETARYELAFQAGRASIVSEIESIIAVDEKGGSGVP